MRKALFLSALALLAAGSGSAIARDRNAVPPAEPVGAPEDCVQINQIRSTRVHGDSTIDFEMAGGKIYRNTLPYGCPNLGFEERFSYRTSLTRLCSVDIIRVLQNYGGSLQEGAGCGLGKFQPVKLVKPEAR